MSAMRFLTFSILFLCSGLPLVSAQPAYQLQKDQSFIRCSVGYLVAGTIKADFNDFSAAIRYDPQDIENSSIDLNIAAASSTTHNRRWDRLIHSSRVLDTGRIRGSPF